MSDDLSKRLDAVERTLTDGKANVASLSDAADIEARVTELERQAADVDERLTELEAAMLAVRGYAGGIRAVNRDVERRTDAALAGVESLAEAVGETPDDEAFEAVCGRGDDGSPQIGGDSGVHTDSADVHDADNADGTNDGIGDTVHDTDDLVSRLRNVL